MGAPMIQQPDDVLFLFRAHFLGHHSKSLFVGPSAQCGSLRMEGNPVWSYSQPKNV